MKLQPQSSAQEVLAGLVEKDPSLLDGTALNSF
jgi:hypothetical protein